MKFPVLEKQRAPAPLKGRAIFTRRSEASVTRDTGLLILRLTMGGLLAGHGSQKLFGWFKGPGLLGTASWLESMGLTPGTQWATAAAASEFGGGLLTSLGLLYPLGPMATMGGMLMATTKAHWGKPIWVTQGGAELPVTNLAIALALTLTGPGRFSLDQLLGIRLPRELVLAAALIEAALIALGIMSHPAPAPTATPASSTTPVSAGERMEKQ